MFCKLSNEPCVHPVVSIKSGHIYEKSLIEKHLKINHSCPMTEEPMTMNDVIEIIGYSSTPQPRQVTQSSIPSLLKTFQNEWDQLMLESYHLKKKLQDTREQLSHSMYQYDAAIRVVARLTQERDKALEELANTRQSMESALVQVESYKALHLQQQSKQTENENKMDVDDEDNDNNNNQNQNKKEKEENDENEIMSSELKEKVEKKALELAKMRKKETKKAPSTLISMDVINKEFAVCTDLCYTAHSATDGGITCMEIDVNYPHHRIISGGDDCQIILYNRLNKKFEHVLKGHNKRINDLKFHPSSDMILSASADKSCIVWKYTETENKYVQFWNYGMNADVLSISIHPLNDYFLCGSRDGYWSFNSLINRKTLLSVNDSNENGVGFNCMELHPDGQILAAGCNNKKLKIWDIRAAEKIGYEFAADDNIKCLNFNENGYYLASAADTNVNIWDLRKINKENNKQFLKTIDCGRRIKCVQFDKTGQYLGVGQPDGIQLYLSKKWTKFAQFKCHNKDVTSIKFAQNAKFIVTASRDRQIKIISNNSSI